MGYLLHHSIDDSADRDGDREAFRFGGAAISYVELAERSNRLANLLIEHGVKRSDRIGIYMLKSLELPIALYGILKAGAAYVPIDPAAPQERVRFLIEDCGMQHLITQGARAARAKQLAQLLAEHGSPLRFIFGAEPDDGFESPTTLLPWQALDVVSAHDPGVRLVSEDLAYVMVTSGSTGVPKGLMHTHRSGLAYAQLSAHEYGVVAQDRLGNHSPLHFDMSTFEYLTGPLCGATSVLIPEEVAMFPRSLAELIERERLTFWYSVPLALSQLLLRGGIEERDLSSLRWVLFGGEPFPPKHLAPLVELWPHARFSNSYGPAEVNQCTAYHLPAGPLDPEEPIPIGPVWPGAEGLIVDAGDQVVATGEVGELLIRSSTMMRGYWRRPDMNRQAFFRRPTFPDFDDVFYRTGDLVRELSDGNLLFLGRKDRQIKVRGYRVELDEVERVIGSLSGVAEAAAIAVPDKEGEAGVVSIVAVVLLREGAQADGNELRRGALQKLPVYAMPASIHVRTELPRTGSGKIDRRALTEEYSN